MFGLSKKERAIEALQRGTAAALSGGFFHIQHAIAYGLNEEASAWLYTEALAHQIYALTAIFNNTIAKEHDWATHEFAVRAIEGAILNHELEARNTPGSVSSFIFRRCLEIDCLSPQQRVDGEQFLQSARKIAELDPNADTEAIAERLGSVSMQYLGQALKMFR